MKFIEGILKATKKQLEWDSRGLFLLSSVGNEPAQSNVKTVPEEEDEMTFAHPWDDLTGEQLDPKEVAKARQEEIGYYRSMNAFKVVPISESWEVTGKAPIGVRWIDTNKGDASRMNIRCRLVAQDFKTEANHELNAGTPPLESLKFVLSHAVTGSMSRCVMINDISRAYLHAPCRGNVYVARCAEDLEGDPPGQTCWKLLRSMYGTRTAAQDWQFAVKEAMVSFGVVPSKSSPNIVYHPSRGIWSMIHGDDFCSSGEPHDLEWLDRQLKGVFIVKTQFLGPLAKHAKQTHILNRLVSWVEGRGIQYEADPRHVERMVLDTGVGDMKDAKVPGANVYSRDGDAAPDGETEELKMKDILGKKSRGVLGKERNPNAGQELSPQQTHCIELSSRVGTTLPQTYPTQHMRSRSWQGTWLAQRLSTGNVFKHCAGT